jgi:hypothetical protein
MMSSVIPARLEYQCGHAALVSLPRIKGESTAQRNERVAREKSNALARQCDFCAPVVEIVAAASELLPTPLEAATDVAAFESVVEGVDGLAAELNGRDTSEDASEEAAAELDAELESELEADLEAESEAEVETEIEGEIEAVLEAAVEAAVDAAVEAELEAVADAGEAGADAEAEQRASTRTQRQTRARRESRASAAATSREVHQYRVVFTVKRIIHAADVRDALRQVEALGARDVLEIVRQD